MPFSSILGSFLTDFRSISVSFRRFPDASCPRAEPQHAMYNLPRQSEEVTWTLRRTDRSIGHSTASEPKRLRLQARPHCMLGLSRALVSALDSNIEAWIPGSTDFFNDGFRDPWIAAIIQCLLDACMHLWIQGCLPSWIHGFMPPCIHDLLPRSLASFSHRCPHRSLESSMPTSMPSCTDRSVQCFIEAFMDSWSH